MIDDITNDLALLDDWLSGKGYGEEAGLCMRAMDLIRKQADEIEKLRAALKGILNAAEEITDDAMSYSERDWWFGELKAGFDALYADYKEEGGK